MSDLRKIQAELIKHAEESRKAKVQGAIPGALKVYGVKNPVLNELAKQYKEGGFDLAEELWKSGAFEERVLAGKLLGKAAKKDPGRAIKLIQEFSSEINDWAICDTLGMQSPKPVNSSHAEEIFSLSAKLIKSKNFWQRRLALVLSEWYTRDKKYHPRIKALLNAVKDDDEYYVKKAVTWINRNFEKKR
jgi:3-methyladenine DNA glycosylase AlkD